MSYFDHVKCHHCAAMIDPEKLGAGMSCPRCGGQLNLTDLFGMKDAFVGMDQGGNEGTLDDLLAPGRLNPYAEDPLKAGGGYDDGRRSARPQGGGASRPQPTAARPARREPERRGLPMGRSSADQAPGMVHVPRQGDDWDDDDDEVGGTPSALELMRKMKKRR